MRQPHRTGRLPDGRQLVTMAQDHPAFKVRRRDGITALNYAYLSDDQEQFAWPRSEMRGLMVDETTGAILARPFQKFWNLGERQTAATDWSEGHVILPKFDGSLVYPAGRRWTTRGGVTDTSKAVEELAESIGQPLTTLLERLRTDPRDGQACTPCFEYVGPDNRIVIEYPTARLVLLAVRRIVDGEYWATSRVIQAYQEAVPGGNPGLQVVRPLASTIPVNRDDQNYVQGLTDHVQGWSASQEGVVIAFEPSGHRLKLKSAAYVALHRARDDYSMEHRVLEVWSNGNQNALCLNLAQDRAQRLRQYYERLEAAIEKASERIGRAARKTWLENGGSRKEAAVAWVAETDNRPPTRAAGFSAFNALARGSCEKAEVREHITNAIRRACHRQRYIEEKVRPLLEPDPPVWKPPDGNQQDSEQC